MRQFNPTKLAMGAIVDGESRVTGLDFHADGTYLVAAGKSGDVHLIDALAGVERKKVYTKTNGGGLVKYTHHETCVLMTSERARASDVRYLSLHDNQYLRYFVGHSGRVNSIAMSPVRDTFVSGSSADQTVCLWDLRTEHPTHRVSLPQGCKDVQVCMSAEGAVLMAMAQDAVSRQHHIKLYDVSMLGNGPFADIAPSASLWQSAFETYAARIATGSGNSSRGGSSNSSRTGAGAYAAVGRKHAAQCASAAWTSLDCSPDGQKILVGTDDEFTLVLDAMSGDDETVPPLVVHNPTSLSMEKETSFGVAYSSDAKYILCGNEDNGVGVFDVTGEGLETPGAQVANLNGHATPVGHIKCNPKYDVVATACHNVALWIQN